MHDADTGHLTKLSVVQLFSRHTHKPTHQKNATCVIHTSLTLSLQLNVTTIT